MNAEKFHANSGVPEISGLTNEQLEQLRNNITKELGRRTIEAMKLLIDKIESKSDDEYESLVDKANVGNAEAQKELSDYQKAKAEIAKVDTVENAVAEAEPETAEAEEPAVEVSTIEGEGTTEMTDAEKDEYLQEGMDKLPDNVLDQAVAEFDADNKGGEDVKEPEEVENKENEETEGKRYDSFAQWNAEEAGSEDFNGVPIGKIEEDDGGIKDEIQKGIEKLAREGVIVKEAEKEGKEEAEEEEAKEDQANEAETEKEVVADIDKLIGQKANEIIEQLREGEIAKAEAKLEENFEQEAKKDEKRGNRMLKFFQKHPKLAKVAVVAIMAIAGLSGTIAMFSGGSNSNKQNIKIEQNNDMIARAAEKAGNVATGAGARIEDEAGAVEQEDNEAEKVSSTARFSIDGKEFTYENMKHEGGYDKGMDSYYDDDKDGQHSMMSPAYEGEWKGTESAFESYEGLVGAMKGSPEMASMIAMVAGIPGAENIHSQSALNDFADELRNKDPEGFDKFMTAASDYINNFVNDGQMVVNVINAGDHYQSTFSYGFNGNLEIGVDKDVHHDSYDVQFVDFLDADGNSMFNSDEAKARIREMFGLPSKADFKAGWSARCGQIVIQMIQVKIVTPEPDETPRPSSTPKPTPSSTPTPTPETSETPTPTPETSETPTPETSETPTPETPTPETPTPETPTPETLPPAPTVTPPVETLTPKGPDTHAGPNQQPMGPTEINNNDTKVTAEERGNANPDVAPGAAVEGTNTEGVNTETINPGGLNQTETTPAPDLSNSASETENVQHGGDAQSLAERMQRAEQAEQQARAAQQAEQAERNQ